MKRVLLINDTSNERHIGSTQVVKNMRKLCAQNDMTVTWTLTRADIHKWDKHAINVVNSCDIVIINGEGSFHHSPVFLNDLVKRRPAFRNKKMFLINTLWESMYHVYLKEFLDQFELIAVRENQSFNELKAQYQSEKIILVPDLIFYTSAAVNPVGYGDSVLPSLKESLRTTQNYFPMNFIDNDPDTQSYMAWLKSLDLYIAGRFHGACLAALVETPFLVFRSNSWKIESLLRDMGCSELLINSFDEIERKKEISKKSLVQIRTYTTQARDQIEQLFSRIRDLIQ